VSRALTSPATGSAEEADGLESKDVAEVPASWGLDSPSCAIPMPLGSAVLSTARRTPEPPLLSEEQRRIEMQLSAAIAVEWPGWAVWILDVSSVCSGCR
jgi:hypothetical protein